MDRIAWLIVGLETFLAGFGFAGMVNGYVFQGAFTLLIAGFVVIYTLLNHFTTPAPVELEGEDE